MTDKTMDRISVNPAAEAEAGVDLVALNELQMALVGGGNGDVVFH